MVVTPVCICSMQIIHNFKVLFSSLFICLKLDYVIWLPFHARLTKSVQVESQFITSYKYHEHLSHLHSALYGSVLVLIIITSGEQDFCFEITKCIYLTASETISNYLDVSSLVSSQVLCRQTGFGLGWLIKGWE